MFVRRNPKTGYNTDLYDRIDAEFRLAILCTHDPEDCVGRHCNIHDPSIHVMSSFPMYWRGDRGIMERICTHGIGHPDPDQLTYWKTRIVDGDLTQGQVEAEMVHGCDGCCAGAYDGA